MGENPPQEVVDGMDGMSNRALFFRMLSDAREEERLKAFMALMGSDDGRMRDVARIGWLVSETIARKNQPSALKEAMEIAEGVVQTSYWNGFIETCGQALIRKGLAMENGQERREILMWGLSMMSRAMGLFVPLSDESIEMIREAKKTDAALSKDASDLIMANEPLAPKFSAIRNERESALELRKKNRTGG